uniref:non-specific serine/threonine protein kinase n=1 Tax=Leptobrachium leishanense TaxID=445787 RepID=A0A8C5PLE8_9ANUR
MWKNKGEQSLYSHPHLNINSRSTDRRPVYQPLRLKSFGKPFLGINSYTSPNFHPSSCFHTVHSENSPIKPRIVTIIKPGSNPLRKITLLLNRRSVQTFEQLVADISEALGFPRWKNDRIRKLYNLKGKEIRSVLDFFSGDDAFIALGKERLTIKDIEIVLNELYPDRSFILSKDDYEKLHKLDNKILNVDSRYKEQDITNNKDDLMLYGWVTKNSVNEQTKSNKSEKRKSKRCDVDRNEANHEKTCMKTKVDGHCYKQKNLLNKLSKLSLNCTCEHGRTHKCKKLHRDFDNDETDTAEFQLCNLGKEEKVGHYRPLPPINSLDLSKCEDCQNQDNTPNKEHMKNQHTPDRNRCSNYKLTMAKTAAEHIEDFLDDPNESTLSLGENNTGMAIVDFQTCLFKKEEKKEHCKCLPPINSLATVKCSAYQIPAEKRDSSRLKLQRDFPLCQNLDSPESGMHNKNEKTHCKESIKSQCTTDREDYNDWKPTSYSTMKTTKRHIEDFLVDPNKSMLSLEPTNTMPHDCFDKEEATNSTDSSSQQKPTHTHRFPVHEEQGGIFHIKRICCIKDKTDIENYYEIGRTIGFGNFAVVKECRPRKEYMEYAMKIIDKSKLKGKEEIIGNEVRIMKCLSHPNIVKLLDDYETNTEIYLILEYVKGGDLFDAINESIKFTEHDAALMMADLCKALEYIHSKHIVHRDVKPENLLVQHYTNGSTTLKLTDFGLAAYVSEPLFAVCGTPTYVAPEILSEKGYGLEVDMWATGVMLYILLCGFPPFRSKERNQEELLQIIQLGVFDFLSPFWDNISVEAKDLVSKLLELHPLKRYSAKSVLQHNWICSRRLMNNQNHDEQ